MCCPWRVKPKTYEWKERNFVRLFGFVNLSRCPPWLSIHSCSLECTTDSYQTPPSFASTHSNKLHKNENVRYFFQPLFMFESSNLFFYFFFFNFWISEQNLISLRVLEVDKLNAFRQNYTCVYKYIRRALLRVDWLIKSSFSLNFTNSRLILFYFSKELGVFFSTSNKNLIN